VSQPSHDVPDLGLPAEEPRSPTASKKPPVEKARTNVYTVMLIVSFLAILTACAVLYFHLDGYGEFMKWWEASASNSMGGSSAPAGELSGLAL